MCHNWLWPGPYLWRRWYAISRKTRRINLGYFIFVYVCVCVICGEEGAWWTEREICFCLDLFLSCIFRRYRVYSQIIANFLPACVVRVQRTITLYYQAQFETLFPCRGTRNLELGYYILTTSNSHTKFSNLFSVHIDHDNGNWPTNGKTTAYSISDVLHVYYRTLYSSFFSLHCLCTSLCAMCSCSSCQVALL